MDKHSACTTEAQHGGCCDSCHSYEENFIDRFIARHPKIEQLTSIPVRLVVGSVLFVLALLLREQATLSFLLFLIGYLIVGAGVIVRAVTGFWRGDIFSQHFLMTVATIGAFAIGEYAEGFAVMILYLIGEGLEDRTVDRTRRSIDALNDIRPLVAHLKTGDLVEDTSPQTLRPGDLILVYPGERVPIDGQLNQGAGFVDYSALTGESRPVAVNMGDTVMAGAINGQTRLELTALRDEQHSAVMRIMDLAEAAGKKKTKIEMFTERFSRVYTPIVVALAVLLVAIPVLIFSQDFQLWLYRALSFLVISCPCALVISVPLAYIAGIGNASKRGIYIRGSQYLEALAKLDTVVFDKTGTLTAGNFTVVDKITASGVDEKDLIRAAAFTEQHSTHPVAEAIRHYADEALIDLDTIPAADKLEELAGHGIVAEKDGIEYLAGNHKLMERHGIEVPLEDDTRAATVIHIAKEGRYLGTFFVADALRDNAKAAMRSLRQQGVRTIAILSGDHENAVAEVAKNVEADHWASELLPEDKLSEFENMKSKTSATTAFVGDGINDAPVLRLADVGIAIGGLGSDAAIESADAVIMTDNVARVADMIAISKRTKKRVFENVILILLVKTMLMVLGAVGIAPLWGAVFADTGVMLLAVLNSLRAYYGAKSSDAVVL